MQTIPEYAPFAILIGALLVSVLRMYLEDRENRKWEETRNGGKKPKRKKSPWLNRKTD